MQGEGVAVNYYNEHDPKAATWLRALIAAGMIPDGHVDERSICDVKGDELRGYLQVHLFAGIGGWPYALALAGWPSNAPVWTGSCPCQPFSSAGKRRGTADERHLWPEMFRLVQECEPATVFGEQVAGADGLKWLAGVRADLEQSEYAVGCADLPAASVGAPHKRQRLFWVADAERQRREGSKPFGQRELQQPRTGNNGSVGDTEHGRREGRNEERQGASAIVPSGGVGGVGNADCERRSRWVAEQRQRSYGNADGSGEGFWDDATLISCGDGKTRRIESGIEPLVNGLPGRVAFLCGLGNAIVPQVAARFIQAYLATISDS